MLTVSSEPVSRTSFKLEAGRLVGPESKQRLQQATIRATARYRKGVRQQAATTKRGSVSTRKRDLWLSMAISLASAAVAVMAEIAPVVGAIGFAFGSLTAHGIGLYSIKRTEAVSVSSL